jgi:hypothetical protein
MFTPLPEDLPIGGREFRDRVLAGVLYKPRCDGGAGPARAARRWLEDHCGAKIEELADTWRAKDWPEINQIQKALSEAPEVRQAVHKFLVELNIDSPIHLGNPRLRVVFPDGHLVTRAAPAYLPHRDTWFANSGAQINWWMPLLPVTESMSFGFSPEFFDRPVDNNSSTFDYQEWTASGGFQRSGNSKRQHPTTSASLAPQRFACELDEYLCFSATHLHQTMPVEGERTRISLDFRTVCASDLVEGRAAPNVDNRSTGDATVDYVLG